MKPRYFNAALILIGLAGAYMAVTSGRLLRVAHMEHRRITQMAGALRIKDPEEICFVRFRSAQPGEFAWRFYVPAEALSASDGVEKGPDHFIARTRFAYSHTGRLVVYTRFRSGWQAQEIGSPALARFVRDHWHRLIIEQAGRPYQQQLKPKSQQTLLRVKIPDQLMAQAQQQLGEQEASRVLPVLFEWQVGPNL
jgi:hypothetical protein